MPPKHKHLTPEERKQLKKQKKQEKKLAKAEKNRQTKRDHLHREVNYGRISYRNYEKQWREMLIKITGKRMKQELEFAWHNFERTMDCKDFTISLLMDELRNSEEQYMRNYRTHSENVSKLMDIFQHQLEDLQEDYNEQVEASYERWQKELDGICETNNENMEYVKTMLHRLEMELRDHKRLKIGEYKARIDESDVKNQILLQKLRAALEQKYSGIFLNIKLFIKGYNKKIHDRKKEHNALKEQDDAVQEVIGQQFKQIRKFYDTIRKLRQKFVDMKQTEGRRLSELENEKNYFAFSIFTLKKKLDEDTENDFGKLAQLSEHSAKSCQVLEALKGKGEAVLSLSAVCRKLETEKEKVLPFPISKGPLPLIDPDELDIGTHMVEMELFWQRMGQAYAVFYALKRERRCLTEENELIVQTHNEYCDELTYPTKGKGGRRVYVPVTDGNEALLKYKRFDWRRVKGEGLSQVSSCSVGEKK